MSARSRARAPRPAPAPARAQSWLAWALPLGALALLAGYGHTLGFAFHFDDFSSIRDNATLGDPVDWPGIWAFRPSRVVLYASLALNRMLTGDGPAGFRAVNLAIHLASALLVGAIARELSRTLARDRAPRDGVALGLLDTADATGLLAALLFVAHPLATQAVTYVVQRTASLCAMFELSAVALSLQARRTGRAASWTGAWAMALLAAFTKEMSVALPLLVLAVHAWPRTSPVARETARAVPWARLAPFALVPLVVAWAAQLPSTKLGVVTGMRETADISRAGYLFTQLTVIPRYLALFAWPRGQNLDPEVLVRTRPDGAVLAGAALLLALGALALSVRRRLPLAALGALWFALGMLPESSVFPIRDVMVEHRTYLPLAGLAWAVAEAIVVLVPRPGPRAALAAVLLTALLVVTHVRNEVWRDEITLWQDVSAKSPHQPRGFNDLAMALEAAGRPREAETAYLRAMALDSTYVYARSNLGRLYGMQGRLRESLRVLQEAARIPPPEPAVLNNLGVTWCALGDTLQALDSYHAAFTADARDEQAVVNYRLLRAAWERTHPPVTR